MKDKILLYQGKFKSFLTKKRKFPLAIYVNLNYPRFENDRDLRNRISCLQHENSSLRKEIKRLKITIQIREMNTSLNREGID